MTVENHNCLASLLSSADFGQNSVELVVFSEWKPKLQAGVKYKTMQLAAGYGL